MRLVGLMAEEWQTIGMARRARGVGSRGNPWQRLRATLGQSFGLLVQAIRRATRLAVTMEARGFGGASRTWARESTYSALDVWVLLGGVADRGGRRGCRRVGGHVEHGVAGGLLGLCRMLRPVPR